MFLLKFKFLLYIFGLGLQLVWNFRPMIKKNQKESQTDMWQSLFIIINHSNEVSKKDQIDEN